MLFEELHDTIPFVRYGKEKVLSMEPYAGITLLMPGRHTEETTPRGGDFVVCVTTGRWKQHQFTHSDIFKDIEKKKSHADSGVFMAKYLDIVLGAEPDDIWDRMKMPGVDPIVFFRAVQCLAVAEHRRYAQYEDKFGGRYLPFRFAAGIEECLWTEADASALQKKGRPGVEQLERTLGVPLLTKELMNGR